MKMRVTSLLQSIFKQRLPTQLSLRVRSFSLVWGSRAFQGLKPLTSHHPFTSSQRLHGPGRDLLYLRTKPLWQGVTPTLLLISFITIPSVVLYKYHDSSSKLLLELCGQDTNSKEYSLSQERGGPFSVYDRLKPNRFPLLLLKPGTGETELRCRLISRYLFRAPQYETLSVACATRLGGSLEQTHQSD